MWLVLEQREAVAHWAFELQAGSWNLSPVPTGTRQRTPAGSPGPALGMGSGKAAGFPQRITGAPPGISWGHGGQHDEPHDTLIHSFIR